MNRQQLFITGIAVIILFTLSFTGATVVAQTSTRMIALDFLWEQPAADTSRSDFAGWNLYRGEAAGGPYVLLATINYGGTAQTTYTVQQEMDSPVGQEKDWYFVLTAFDKSGNESVFSNEALARVDLKPPSAPVMFKVTVRVVPQ
jgi:hypothetical protein